MFDSHENTDTKCCRFDSGSPSVLRHEKGKNVLQMCTLHHESTFFCSSLVKSKPINKIAL